MKKLAFPVLLLALLGAACSSGGDEPGVASLRTGLPTAVDYAASPSPTPNTEEVALAFTRCMRDNGVPEFPDPEFDAEGQVILRPLPETIDQQALQQAFTACRPMLREVVNAFGPEDTAEFQDAMLDFARCMRKQGVTGFPDPDFNGTGPFFDPQAIDRQDPALLTAFAACREHLSRIPGFSDQGSGGGS
jgi:hypothetical protein